MNKITRNITAILTIGLGSTLIANAQVTSQKVGTNPTMKQPSAVLEVESANKGLLMPRVTLTSVTDAVTIANPANALTVFNTATAGTAPNDVTPGYYYWSSAENKWIRLLNQNDAAEPWQVESTSDKATSNTQNIYQNANVGIGDFSFLNVKAKLQVENGAVRFGLLNQNENFPSNMGGSDIGEYSGTIGRANIAKGAASVAMGSFSKALAENSFALGSNTTASSVYETSIGRSNAITTGDDSFVVPTDALFQIGNGTSGNGNGNNALTILKNAHTAIGVTGSGSAAKPTELLDLGGSAIAGEGGLKLRNINSAPYTGDISTDKVVVADTDGVLKTVETAELAVEPWQTQTTTDKATLNTDNIYQTGSVAIGDFSTAASTKKMEVKGDFKSEISAAGGATGTEVGSPLNPNGAMHYWFSSLTNYRIASASDQAALLQGVSGTTTNAISASDIQSEMSSVNGNNSLSTARTLNTGEFRLESYNVADNFGSTVSLQNDGLRLRHTNTNGAADPFPLNNSSEIFVQKANGVRFNFRDAAAVQTGEYWFPTTSGTNGQVMTQTATGKMVWSNPSTLFSEVDGVIGNEVTDATVNGGLTRAGAGTDISPYTLGLTPGTAAGNIMTWNGTAWNPAAPVNIYNANGTLTSNRTVSIQDKQLTFIGDHQETTMSVFSGLLQEGRANSPFDGRGSIAVYGADKDANGRRTALSLQSFADDNVAISAYEDATALIIGTNTTQVAAPIIFQTSAGGGDTVPGTEKMRITGTGNIGLNTSTPTEKLDNDGITRLRNLPVNGATNAINTTSAGAASSAQDQTFTATRTVVADANGVLGTVAGLPATPVNIYNANGTLTGARTVTTANNNLTFAGTGSSVLIATNATEGRVTATGTSRGSITVTGGNSIVDVYADNNLKGQIAARGTGTTGLDIRTEGATPLSFLTNNSQRMRITPTGEVAIGATTAPSLVVGGATIQPLLHVAGDISTTGKLWTTNSVYADYVFEDYFNGFSKIYKNYKFKSLKEVAQFIKTNKHLPGVTPISEIAVGENGYTIDLTQLSMQQLEKLEELYLHVIEMNDTLSQKDIEIDALQHKTNELEERLKKLESLLIKQ